MLECHHVACADSYVMTGVAGDLQDLERFLASSISYGDTRTSIVFFTPIPRRGLVPPDAGRQARRIPFARSTSAFPSSAGRRRR